MITFANAWFMGNFRPTKIFVIAFLIDFTIRLFINPQYSPSMIVGAFCGQEAGAGMDRRAAEALRLGDRLGSGPDHALADRDPERDRADQHAGLCHLPDADVLRVRLRHLHRLQDLQRPPEPKAQHCAGGACEVLTPHASQRVGAGGTAIVLLFLAADRPVVASQGFPAAEALDAQPVMQQMHHSDAAPASSEADRCTPPAFAVAMGHAEKWKLHNNCK
jgi:hypothetical protein